MRTEYSLRARSSELQEVGREGRAARAEKRKVFLKFFLGSSCRADSAKLRKLTANKHKKIPQKTKNNRIKINDLHRLLGRV